ncbi:MAG: hypothetical protein AAFQ80_07560 [Cyanobacteria bacterium J06621_8]
MQKQLVEANFKIIRTFLQQNAKLIVQTNPRSDWTYNSFEELVLSEGQEMASIPLPNSIEAGLPRNCYFNCRQALNEHPELNYCEGYALAIDYVLPVPHAWLVNSSGEALDPTWQTPAAYVGVAFDRGWLYSFLSSRNRDYLAVFEANHLENYSLLWQGLPYEALLRE